MFRLALLCLIALPLPVVSAAAELPLDPSTYVGNVYGTVTDASGKPLRDALVSIREAGRLVCSSRTDAGGGFLINSIPAPFDGLDYDVSAEHEACGTARIDTVRVLPGASMALEVSLALPQCGDVALGGEPATTTWRYRHQRDEIEIAGSASGATRDPTTDSFTRSIFATREGLVGGTTANGHVIVVNDHFVALPSTRAISNKYGHGEQLVRVTYRDRSVVAPVWDIGPWNIHDDYWSPPAIRESFKDLPQGKPESEAAYYDGYNGGLDERGRVVKNPAGIDLADGTFWIDLGMFNNDRVTVEYLWLDGEGPLASGISASPNPAATGIALTLDATVSDLETGNSPLAAAEVFIDTIGSSGTGISVPAFDGAFDSASETIHTAIPTTEWLPGTTHVVFLHARDSYENWGAFTSTTVTVVKQPRVRSVRR